MKKNIAIVAGGDSSEAAVSLKSAQGIYSFLDKEKYNVYIIILKGKDWFFQNPDGSLLPVDKNDFSVMLPQGRLTFDLAYITIHGTPGEDGRLQGYFDMIRMPYSCCGSLAANITFNKYVCNHYLKGFGYKIAESILLRKGDEVSDADVVAHLGLPCFVKPNVGGSSFATTKVKSREQIQPAIREAFAEGAEVIIESFMSGTEVTCGCYKVKGKTVVLPITEVVSHNEFFDYNAKYTGEVEEITPARIPEQTAGQIGELTSRLYDIIGCKGIIRTDYIIIEGVPHLLEVNTTPGMTATSFIPQQVRAAGLDIKDVLTEIIENELHK